MENTQVREANKEITNNILKIVFADNRGNHHERSFLMHEMLEAKDQIDFNTHNIVSLTADGEALKRIKTVFSVRPQKSGYLCTIPMKNDVNEMVWYGDIAKTILANF